MVEVKTSEIEGLWNANRMERLGHLHKTRTQAFACAKIILQLSVLSHDNLTLLKTLKVFFNQYLEMYLEMYFLILFSKRQWLNFCEKEWL